MPNPDHSPRGWLETIYQEHTLNIEVATEIDGLALLMRTMRNGIGATLQPGAVISHLGKETLRVIGAYNPMLSHPNFLVSLPDDELTPTGLAARVVLTKVTHQLVGAGSWSDAVLYNN